MGIEFCIAVVLGIILMDVAICIRYNNNNMVIVIKYIYNKKLTDSDILFPVSQQREIYSTLKQMGNYVSYKEVSSPYGHDTFLLDVENIGASIAQYLRFSPPHVPTSETVR